MVPFALQPRSRCVALLAFAVLALLPARASAALWLAADATEKRGTIQFSVVATSDHSTVTFGEYEGTVARPSATLPLAYYRDHPEYGTLNVAFHDVPWRCDRTERRFWIAGRRPDGVVDAAFFDVRTPSCRNRLALDAPLRARVGGRPRITVTDTWTADEVRARLCVRPPHSDSRCGGLRIGGAADRLTRRVRTRREGRWRIVLRAPDQKLVHTLSVGVPVRTGDPAATGPPILVTGDSMMQSVDAILGDELAAEADVTSDVRVGSGVSKPQANWGRIARRQVAAHRPVATVLLLGTNDANAMTTPAGDEVECCEEPWVAEYARRARDLMRTYAQNGAGAVVWITIPVARDPRRHPFNAAVNRATLRAAEAVPGVTLLRADTIFTPGGRYRDDMTIDGQSVRVRETDGIHFSIPGARYAAQLVVDQLRRLGILSAG